MIQDIMPHQYNNEYQPVPPEKDSFGLYYDGRATLIKKTENEITYPTFEELEHLKKDLYEEYTYLFTIDKQRFYLIREINPADLEGYTMEGIELFRFAQPRYLAFAGITGFQLHNWYRGHQYCGRCGEPMKKDEKERMMFCESCHNMEYPKICPATIIGVTHGNRILMSKYAGRTYKNYALLAGFVEIGETVEETVKREVMEEVGLKVKNIRYYKSQPWSFSDTLLMGFFVDLDGDEEIVLDREELALAEWFEREDVPDVNNDDSLTNEMIMAFKNHIVD